MEIVTIDLVVLILAVAGIVAPATWIIRGAIARAESKADKRPNGKEDI